MESEILQEELSDVQETNEPIEDVSDAESERESSGSSEQRDTKTGNENKEEDKAEEAPKSKTYKINGQEVELTDEEVTAIVQKGVSAEEKFRQSKEMQDNTIKILSALKENPEAVLDKMGINVENFVRGYVNKRIEEENKTPEQRQQEERDRQYKQERDELNTLKREIEEIKTVRAMEDYSRKINQAIDSDAELAGDAESRQEVTRRIASYMYYGLQKGVQVNPADALKLVKEDMVKEGTGLAKKLKPDQIAQALGDDGMKSLAEYLASKGIVHQTPNKGNGTVTPQSEKKPAKPKKISKKEWREEIQKRLNDLQV